MRLSANLPHDLWPETVSAAAYILNRTPIFRTGITLFEALYKTKPRITHMKTQGCRAYPLIYNIPKLQKLEPRAHIGYLVGYSSRNIYRIWILSKKQVIRIRDVTFNENVHYQLDDVDAAQLVQEDKLNHVIQILQELPKFLLAYNQDEHKINIPNFDITPPSTTKQPDKTTTGGRNPYLSPPPSDVADSTTSSPAAPPGETRPTNVGEGPGEESGEGLGEGLAARYRGSRNWSYQPATTPASRSNKITSQPTSDFILSTRTRNRQQAHAATLNNLGEHAGYHAAFANNTIPKKQIHHDSLPQEPKHWKQMLKHKHSQQFIQAAKKEFEHLQSRGTFQLANRTASKNNLPLI